MIPFKEKLGVRAELGMDVLAKNLMVPWYGVRQCVEQRSSHVCPKNQRAIQKDPSIREQHEDLHMFQFAQSS